MSSTFCLFNCEQITVNREQKLLTQNVATKPISQMSIAVAGNFSISWGEITGGAKWPNPMLPEVIENLLLQY